MKVDITEEEYRALLDLLFMAHWVLNSHKTEEDPRTKAYEKVIQKFYTLAEAMGHAGMVDYDPEAKTHDPSRRFEEATRAWEFIDEFTDDTFWDELVHRLAERDAGRTVGGYEQFDRLKAEDRLSLETPFLDRFSKEVDEHGLDRLEIVEQFGPITAGPARTSD